MYTMKTLTSLLVLLAGAAFAIEKPDYDVLQKNGKLELRKYADLPVVSAPMAGMNQRNDSFGQLFQYISGANKGEQKIKMTSPVFMEGSHKDRAPAKSGTMSFMIPSKVAKEGTPDPTGSAVSLGKIKGGTIAAIRFKGWKSEADRKDAIDRLQAWVREQGWKSAGEPFFAIYNPPWTPEFMRRNEVWLRVTPSK